MNDEYGRDNLGEMVGLLGFPHQKTNEYSMARYSGLNQNMLTGVPYSVLTDDDHAPTAGDRLSGSSSLEPKTGLWTTSAGRLEIEDYNRLARGFRPEVLTEPHRYLDEEWVKRQWATERADDLYRVTQRGSRNLEGRGAGLRRADLPSSAG